MNSFNLYNAVWIEITKADHGHGGVGWEFGTCLWSPTADRSGRDRYAVMREPHIGDLVLHFYNDVWEGSTETRLAGTSTVATQYQEITNEPPTPGPWADFPSYYRINLVSYTAFPFPVSFHTLVEIYGTEILQEIDEFRPRRYPFNTYGSTLRTVQGGYLTKCTAHLYSVFRRALGISETASTVTQGADDLHQEYAEGVRIQREVHFFSRNPQLAKRAKAHYGYTCQGCGFNFRDGYGNLGEGYAECHHLTPLSERPESEWNQTILNAITDVTVLCANCHRMIHRKRPALTLEQLIDTVQTRM
ncbi:MAG: hypothetical protein CL787_05425 [Chloroflexi bacterium]|nr:hypothetical protein [Chloroflexota bacterium]